MSFLPRWGRKSKKRREPIKQSLFLKEKNMPLRDAVPYLNAEQNADNLVYSFEEYASEEEIVNSSPDNLERTSLPIMGFSSVLEIKETNGGLSDDLIKKIKSGFSANIKFSQFSRTQQGREAYWEAVKQSDFAVADKIKELLQSPLSELELRNKIEEMLRSMNEEHSRTLRNQFTLEVVLNARKSLPLCPMRSIYLDYDNKHKQRETKLEIKPVLLLSQTQKEAFGLDEKLVVRICEAIAANIIIYEYEAYTEAIKNSDECVKEQLKFLVEEPLSQTQLIQRIEHLLSRMSYECRQELRTELTLNVVLRARDLRKASLLQTVISKPMPSLSSSELISKCGICKIGTNSPRKEMTTHDSVENTPLGEKLRIKSCQ